MNSRALTISVVILTCDRPALLEKALKSLQRQTLPPDEVIIVDDSRTLQGQTAKVCNTYIHNPIIKRNQYHGIAAGRWIGMKAAQGDVIVYLDDDCEASSTYIERFHDHFSRDTTLSAVTGYIQNGYPNNLFASAQYAYYDRGIRRHFPVLSHAVPLESGRMLDCEVLGIRRPILAKIGFTQRHVRYRNDDIDLGIRLLEHGYHILFDPTITARSYPRTNLFSFWKRRFGMDFPTQRRYRNQRLIYGKRRIRQRFLTGFAEKR